MNPKIILISMSPYEESIVCDHYFQKDFEKEGYKFEFWSLSEYFKGFNYSKEIYPFTRYFKSPNELIKALNNEPKPFYCNVQIALTTELYPVFKAIEKNAEKFYQIQYLEGTLSLMYKKRKTKSFINKIFDKSLIKKIYKKLFLIYYQNSEVNKKMIKFNPPNTSSILDLEVHHFDYITNKKTSTIKHYDNEYFLFIDQGLPSHPDFNLSGLKNIDKRLYLKEMNDFFDYVENKFQIPVVIAAHPKSNYSKTDFINRDIIKYKTAELTKGAKALFSHYSTSFNYAILNYKPIILLTMNEFFNSNNNTGLHTKIDIVKNISDLFDLPILNINKDLDDLTENVFFVNKEKYDEYINKYLISRNRNMSNFEIVRKYLNL